MPSILCSQLFTLHLYPAKQNPALASFSPTHKTPAFSAGPSRFPLPENIITPQFNMFMPPALSCCRPAPAFWYGKADCKTGSNPAAEAVSRPG